VDVLSKLLIFSNSLDSKQLCPLLHQNGFEVTSSSDLDFTLNQIDSGHFHFALIEAESPYLGRFSEKVKKHPTLNALLICKKKELTFCPYALGFLGHLDLSNFEALIQFLKSYFKQLSRDQLLKSVQPIKTDMIIKSPIMKELLEKVDKLAKTQSSVLLTGESGTGKEVIANLIHEKSFRSMHPFVAINSCAISPQLLESELFGYEKGAFTGATSKKMGRLEFANFGTFFFDEIGEAPLDLQAKLLRVIQEKSFERVGGLETISLNVRFIAATNRDLKQAIINKEFREDLYYRLNVIPVHIPPLRERKEDIIPLAEYFIQKYAKKNQIDCPILSKEACSFLINYSWPGNIRELSNLIERACILSNQGVIVPTDFSCEAKSMSLIPHEEIFSLDQLEKKAIFKALEKTGGNKTQAAKLLGLSIKTLRAKLG